MPVRGTGERDGKGWEQQQSACKFDPKEEDRQERLTAGVRDLGVM